jgi:hypothetical protein
MKRDSTLLNRYCGMFEARSLEDALGATCGREARLVCSDCGLSLCPEHTEKCSLCEGYFCPSCLSFHSREHSKAGQAEDRQFFRKSA